MDCQSPLPGWTTDTRLLRGHLGAFATGVTIITVGGDSPHGMTANAFTSVSLDPPLLLVCIEHAAVMHDSLMAAGSFGISVLSSHQEDVARHFANRLRPLGGAQFDLVEWTPGQRTGAPLIVGALARFECRLSRIYEGGDHTIFLGSLVSMDRRPGDDALLFLNGRFHQILERTDVTA